MLSADIIAFYLNRDIVFPDSKVYRVGGISCSGANREPLVLLHQNRHSDTYYVSEVSLSMLNERGAKFILRHLNDLSEDECRHIYELSSNMSWEDRFRHDLHFGSALDWWADISPISERVSESHIGYAPAWRYLLSLGIDLFNLIPENHAIDQKELQK